MDINTINAMSDEDVRTLNNKLARRLVTKLIVTPLVVAAAVLVVGAIVNKAADNNAN